MIEGIYFFGDQIRWNLGWPNPNPAGAFVAMCLMFLFVGHYCFRATATRRWHFFGLSLFLIESGLWFLLCKTYSRGALLAAVCGTVFYFVGLILFQLQGVSRLRAFAGLFLRFALLACLLWGTGFFGRIDPGFVAQDASVGNRRVLWEGGLQMIWHKPWAGWGTGESGSQFMHWFQPVDASEKYAGMVNSYLHIAVERGLPFLVLCLSVLACFVSLVFFRGLGSKQNERKSIFAALLASAAVIVVFLVANIFNTLWIFPRLWIPVSLAGALILVAVSCHPLRCSLFGRSLGASLATAILLAPVLFAGGYVLAGKAPFTIRFEQDTVVLASHSGAEAPDTQWLLAMDSQVFGEDWGKEVRRLAVALEGQSIELLVLPLQADGAVLKEDWSERFLKESIVDAPHVLMTSGRLYPPPELSSSVDQLIWLHPDATGSLADEASPDYDSILLLFPMMDLAGGQGGWKRAAREHGWIFTASGALTDDVRPVWPEVLLRINRD